MRREHYFYKSLFIVIDISFIDQFVHQSVDKQTKCTGPPANLWGDPWANGDWDQSSLCSLITTFRVSTGLCAKLYIMIKLSHIDAYPCK